jgi:hypothetical protein
VKQGINKVGLWGKPVAIVGSRGTGSQITKLLKENWELGYNPIAVFDYPLASAGGPLEDLPYEGLSLIEIADMARKRGVNICYAPLSPRAGGRAR